jgi:F like protein/ADP-ribosyltransferase exoenzyme
MQRIEGLSDPELLTWEARIEAAMIQALAATMERVAKIIEASMPKTASALILVGADPPMPPIDDGLPPGQPYVSPDDLAAITPAWQEQVALNLLPIAAQVWTSSSGKIYAGMVDATGITNLPALGSLAAEQYLAQAQNTFEQIGNDLWENARGALLDGFQQGESIPELADRLRGAAGTTARTATLVARSQVIEASNAGSIAMARVSGLQMAKEWIATPDLRTRPTHLAADGQQVPLDEQFRVGGEMADFPCDPSLSPSERYNCRCTIGYVMTSMDTQQAIEDNAPEPPLPNTSTLPNAPVALSPTGEGGLSNSPAVREVQIENRIRSAFAQVIAEPREVSGVTEWAGLADIRPRLGDIPRAEQDAALLRLLRTEGGGTAPNFRAIPLANMKALKLADREAALTLPVSGQEVYAIKFRDYSLRPLPALSEASGPIARAVAPTAEALGKPMVRASLLKPKTLKGLTASMKTEMRSITGRDIAVEIPEGMSVLTTREYFEGIARGLEQYPETRLRRIGTYLRRDDSYAEATGDTIEMNEFWLTAARRPQVLASLKGDIADWSDTRIGWHTRAADTPVSLGLHEFAHIIDQNNLGNGKIHSRVLTAVHRRAGVAGVADDTLIGREISAYATANPFELVAEAFTDVQLRGAAASPLSHEIVDIVSAEYRARGFAIRTTAEAADQLEAEALAAERLPALSRAAIPKSKIETPAERSAAVEAALSKQTVSELRMLAKERGVAIPTGARKAEIVRLLSEAPSVPAESGLPAAALAKQTVTQLRALAKERGIVIPTGTRKPEILRLLSEPPSAAVAVEPGVALTGEDALAAAQVALRTAAERKAYADYVSEYRNVNGLLRENAGHIPDERAWARERRTVAGLDSAMARSELRSDIDVYRVSEGSEFARGIPVAGAEWTDYGFTSTSVGAKVPGRNSVQLHIRVPAGTRAVAAKELDEGEVLLDRGTRFKVIKVDGPDAMGVYRVEAEVIPPAAEAGALEGDAVLRATAVHPVGAQLKAIDRYGGDGGYVINDDLRANAGNIETMTARNRATVEELDAVFDQASIPEPVVLYRKMDLTRGPFGDLANADRDLTGFTWTEDAYSSTSIEQRLTGGRSVQVRIVAPRGTRAISQAALDSDEVLLDRGTSFRVVADRGKNSRFDRVLDVEVVPRAERLLTEAEQLAAERRAIREAARATNRLIESQTSTARLLAKVDELTAKKASRDVIAQELDPALLAPEQLYANASEAVAQSLRTALATGDPAKLRAAITRAQTDKAAGTKIAPIGKAGAKVTFDADTMEGVGGIEVAPGAQVTIIRRGSTLTLPDGKVLQLEKAQVTPVAPKPAPVKRVPKVASSKAPTLAVNGEKMPSVQIRNMHRLEDPETGMKVKVSGISRVNDYEDSLDLVLPETRREYEKFIGWPQVDVKILSGAGATADEVGYATVLFAPDGQTVYYAALALDAPIQGQGFITRLMGTMFERYKAAGVKTLGIRANADVGGYAWARAGFEFFDDSARSEFAAYARAYARGESVKWYDPGSVFATTRRAKLDAKTRAALLRVADNPDAQPIDYAMVGHEGGSKLWPGKEFMLGSAWRGKMDL